MTTANPSPNLRVLEVASLVPGPYCGKLLGANVIKAEPPTGDPSRRRGPFPDDIPHPERSGMYLYLNTGKQSVTLHLADPSGRELLHQLVASVDMVIHDCNPVVSRQVSVFEVKPFLGDFEDLWSRVL